jgi:hypothetical protein
VADPPAARADVPDRAVNAREAATLNLLAATGEAALSPASERFVAWVERFDVDAMTGLAHLIVDIRADERAKATRGAAPA